MPGTQRALCYTSALFLLVGKTPDERLSEPGARGCLLYKAAWSLKGAQEMTLEWWSFRCHTWVGPGLVAETPRYPSNLTRQGAATFAHGQVWRRPKEL